MSYVDVINYAAQPITMLTLLVLFLAVLLLFLYNYKNLLQTIILLELLTFMVLSLFSQLIIASPSSDHLIIVLLSLFVPCFIVFCTDSYILLYLSYESSIVPIFYIIVK